MAAGLSRSQKYGITKRYLEGICRDLKNSGVLCKYKDWMVVSVPSGKFQIYISWGNMSNGESVGTATVRIGSRVYWDSYGYSKTAGTFKEGIKAIKEEFGGMSSFGTHANPVSRSSGPVELVQRGYDGAGKPKYVIMFNGKYWGDIYFNMTGYTGAYIPLPPTYERNGKIGNLDIGEVSISKVKKEISFVNSEWKRFEKTKSNPSRKMRSLSKRRYADVNRVWNASDKRRMYRKSRASAGKIFNALLKIPLRSKRRRKLESKMRKRQGLKFSYLYR